MSLILVLIIAVVFLGFLVIVLHQKNIADNAKHAAAIQKTIADSITMTQQHQQVLDTNLQTLYENQRHEKIETDAHLSDRADFNNDWNGVRQSGTDISTSNSHVDTFSTSGSASDHSH